MKLSGICFSETGAQLLARVDAALAGATFADQDVTCSWYSKDKLPGKHKSPHIAPIGGSLHEWVETLFPEVDALLFVAQSGVAVRAIAPYVRDKRHDPAVLVMDEKGQYCIPLLAGHVDGANDFARMLAERMGIRAVITKIENAQDQFDVISYASKQELVISNLTYAKEVAAALASGEPVGFYTHFKVEGDLPAGVLWSDKLDRVLASGERAGGISLGIYISPSYNRAYFDHTLWLIPRCLDVGIVCDPDAEEQDIAALYRDQLGSLCLYEEAVRSVVTTAACAEAPGLVRFCRHNALSLQVVDAGGDGNETACARCALVAEGNSLLTDPVSKGDVCLAVAIADYTVLFEKGTLRK